MSSQGATN